MANLVKRSDMAFSWRSEGRMMWTSGWGHCGSWMLATVAAARTITGMSCVMVVSRSWGKKVGFASPKESVLVSALSLGKGAFSGFAVVVAMEFWGRAELRLLVTMVRESKGMLSFLVKRMEAEEALRADRRARWRGARGIRRLMVLFSMAD